MTDKEAKKTKVPDVPKSGKIDADSEDSFPASDPPSHSPGTAGRPSRKKRNGAKRSRG